MFSLMTAPQMPGSSSSMPIGLYQAGFHPNKAGLNHALMSYHEWTEEGFPSEWFNERFPEIAYATIALTGNATLPALVYYDPDSYRTGHFVPDSVEPSPKYLIGLFGKVNLQTYRGEAVAEAEEIPDIFSGFQNGYMWTVDRSSVSRASDTPPAIFHVLSSGALSVLDANEFGIWAADTFSSSSCQVNAGSGQTLFTYSKAAGKYGLNSLPEGLTSQDLLTITALTGCLIEKLQALPLERDVAHRVN